MPVIEAIDWLKQSAAEVLETMCFIEVVGSLEGELDGETEWLTATVNFAGDKRGRVGICAPYEVARNMTANFLGEDAEDIDRQGVAYGLGEIANMICGGFVHYLGAESVYDLLPPACEFALVLPESSATIERIQLDDGSICVWANLE
jgi:CheY-specific phosphatase CheX